MAGVGTLEKSLFLKNFKVLEAMDSSPQMVPNLAAKFDYGLSEADGRIIHFNPILARELKLDVNLDKGMESLLLAESPSPFAFAYNYGGHQFGHWADQLGDGRAVVIGSLCGHELQLKGAGRTPFSRQGDGRAVLRSSIREYLASEALYQLGVPTTRALSLGLTGERVLRDKFYDGHAAYETGAIVCRTAPNFIRFGSFQLPMSRGEKDQVEDLVRFVAEKYYHFDTSKSTQELALELLDAALERSAELVALWQSLGFTHGVLNTDNMSILGLTIDYGPFGFLEKFDPSYTPNTSDLPGRRYRFEQQPAIFEWNLYRLAECFLPFVDEKKLTTILETFSARFTSSWESKIKSRFVLDHHESHEDAMALVGLFFKQVQLEGLDFNFVLRELAEAYKVGESKRFGKRMLQYYHDLDMNFWDDFQDQLRTLHKGASDLGMKMSQNNPRIILKNHLLSQIISDADQGDYKLFEQVFDLISKPYEDWAAFEALWAPAPHLAENRDAQMNSCSS